MKKRQRRRPTGTATAGNRLTRAAIAIALLLTGTVAQGAPARVIVRMRGGLASLQVLCRVLGCSVQSDLGDPDGQVFVLALPGSMANLASAPGVLQAEVDVMGKTLDSVNQGTAPPSLYDSTPVGYFGMTVREGYVTQPATDLIRLADAQKKFHVRGSGVVAVIDTGVDATHPVLHNVLLSGYDFTRGRNGADEKGDIKQSTTAVIDQSTTAVVDQSTTAVIDQSTAAVIDQAQYAAFGHGTMVAGIVHLVAPGAIIMPLKAFHADGTGYASDVIRAIYYAVRNNAKVINMSFSFPAQPRELNAALAHAAANGVISVAAAGNDGRQTLVYPAALQSNVMGVASTSNNDTLSTFSNYGPKLVWVGAPGEGVITLFPYGTYAATWGTSFAAPFVAGTAALLQDLHSLNESQAAAAIAHAKYISSSLGNGRLDIYQALASWQQSH